MIRYKLAELMAKMQFESGTRLAIQDVAEGTGVNRMTISKILNQRGYTTGLDTIDRLCTFFNCKIEDLIEHVPD